MMKSLDNKSYEPPMLLQRPSLGRSQDVSHILANAFRDLTRESVGEQTVKNLTISRSGEESFHEDYVERLATIQSERQRQLDELAMLEAHIMQARAAATVAEEQELQRATEEYSNYESLGLPPVKSHLRYCMDIALLKRFHLITPDDYVPAPQQTTKPPRGSSVPSYARQTTSSMMRYNKDHIPDNYLEDDVEMNSQFNSDLFMQFTEKNSSQVSKRKSATCKSRMTSSWRESIKPDQRYKERTDLQRLNAKSEFLRNPRNVTPTYPTLTKSSKKPSPKTLGQENEPNASVSSFKSSDILVPSPSPVIFKVYEIGEVYEIKLELKNVSSAMRQIRVIPPATKFFSVGLGQYPGEHGMIAPGMSCQFAVKFAPDSLMDFEDKIQIRTQLDDFLEIMLMGKRKPPELTLSDVLDLGFCLVGGKKNIDFNCLNVGGPGRFCFVEESKWPTTSCEWILDNPGFVDLDPFCLKPAMFQLFEGQQIPLQLMFQPQTAKFYKQNVFLVCDNCQVKQFTIQGVGQTARVEFLSVDGGVSQTSIGESQDPSANYLVKFDDQHPCTKTVKSLLVKNLSNVALPFHWKITKPYMRNNESEVSTEQKQEQLIDKDSVFNVYPDNGVLQPGSSFEFKIECSPSQIGMFDNVGHLILEKVPIFRPDENVNQIEEDITTMKIELKVLSKPYQLVVNPPVMVIPGKLLVGKFYIYHVKIKNNSVSKVRFEWEISDNEVIDIQPHSGYLDAEEEDTFEVKICGNLNGLFEKTIYCNVIHSTDPIYIHVRAEFEGPQVKVENPEVDFGLVRLGDSVVQKLLLRNTSELPAFWSLQENSYYHLLNIDECYKEMPSEFQFIPDNGQLLPYDEVIVDVVFTPLTSRRVRSVFECTVINSPPSFIRLVAEVQTPNICILSSVVTLDEMYVDVPVVKQIEIENKTLLETKFYWNECVGDDSETCTVQFQPNDGILGPRERKQITVLLTCSKQGLLRDLVAVCGAEGMEESVYMAISGTVFGLEVSFKTESVQSEDYDNVKDDLFLDFGKTVIGETRKTSLVITNKSAIKTSFCVDIEHFHAGRTPTPPAGGTPNWKTRGTGILAKTPNISDPLSKTPAKAQADYCRSLLRDGKGAAFVCSPSVGELQPFQEQVIEITAYSDMWGEYKDNVVCKIDGLKEKRIPLALNVQGCPLNFQMTKDRSPVVRFGTHVSGAPSVERVLRVNNDSPCDIRIDWEVYNEEKDDNQLIDLIVDVGNPFPKLMKPKGVKDKSNEETKKLITVNIRKHTGTRSDSTFSVNPSQQIVPARKHSDVRVKFNPCSNKNTTFSCSSFVLGFINLDNPSELHNEYVKRNTGRHKEPFRLNMTGGIKPAVLSIDIDDDEGSHFKICASDLLKLSAGNSVEVMKEIYKKKHFILCNTTQANVNFSVVVDKPFSIMNLNAPPSAYLGNKEKKDRTLTLKPRKNTQVAVGFCLSSDLLLNDNHPEFVIESCENGILPCLEIEKTLEIKFLNTTSQTMPLLAHISLPLLLLSKESVDFGVCLVGQPKELNVQLTNYGKSCSQWFAEKDPQYPEESREVFNCLPQEGFLEGHLSHISNNNVLLKLIFIPRYNVNYECLLVFKGLLCEPPRYLLLSGCGSFDGAREEIVTTTT